MDKYLRWYEKQYGDVIGLSDFTKRTSGWLEKSMKNFVFKYSSVWRHEVLDNLKYNITPKKVEQICTVFKIDRSQSMGKDRTVEFHTSFAFLYSHADDSRSGAKGAFEHDYVCMGPTFQSSDGEYRYRFISFKQFQHVMKQFEKLTTPVEEQVVKWLGEKKMSLQAESFMPFALKTEKHEKAFLEQIDKERMVIQLYTAVWLLEYKRYDDDSQENHLVPGFKQAMFSKHDQKFYHTKIKPLEEKLSNDVGSFNAFMDHILTSPKQYVSPAVCGQKFIPLRVMDVEDPSNIKFAPWREMYISSFVGDLVINGITPSFPIFVDWFYISTNSPEIWDNKISHLKLEHSMVATDIVRKLEDARKHTYRQDDDEEVYISYKMQGMSDAIEVPMSYAEKEIILAPVTLCSLVEHVGRTVADMPEMLKRPWYVKELGPLFTDIAITRKYLFEYIYALYCANCKFQLIHSDLHLNNVCFYSVRTFYPDIFDPESKPAPEATNAHVIYDLSSEGKGSELDDVYVFPHYGRYACIIDFSRGFVGREKLMQDFPENRVDDFISSQRRRLLRVMEHEVPDFYNSHKDQIEALLLQNFDLGFKLLTALDTYKLMRGLRSLLDKIKHDPEVEKLLDKIVEMALKFLTLEMQRAFRREIREPKDIEWPNRTIIRECFRDGLMKHFDEKASRRDDPEKPITIIDLFTARNELKYNIREYEKFPPAVKFDYMKKHGIPQDKTGMKNFEKHQQYLKKEPIEKKIEKISEEVRAEKEERRGVDKKSVKSAKKEADSAELYSDL
jgi:hypothetical protein